MKNKFDFNKMISHRGIFDNIKVMENSLEAFEISASLGIGIELDVRPTRDYEIVVTHDYSTERFSDSKRVIFESSYSEIVDAGVKLPTLIEVLELVRGRVPLYIELKSLEKFKIKKVIKKVEDILDNYEGEVYLQSMDPSIKSDKYSTGVISFNFNSYSWLTPKYREDLMNLKYLESHHSFVSYKHSDMTPTMLKKLKKNKLSVFSWTINDPLTLSMNYDLYDKLIFEIGAFNHFNVEDFIEMIKSND